LLRECGGVPRWCATGLCREEERGIKKFACAVFDPPGVVAAERFLPPPIPDLDGMRLGVVDDTNRNANRLLRKTAAGRPGSAHRSRSRVAP
jgi:hypothetical protein